MTSDTVALLTEVQRITTIDAHTSLTSTLQAQEQAKESKAYQRTKWRHMQQAGTTTNRPGILKIMDKQTQQTLANLAVAKQHREATERTINKMRPLIDAIVEDYKQEIATVAYDFSSYDGKPMA